MAATKKKSPVKSVKSTAAHKAPKKAGTKKAKVASVRSFRRSEETVPFFTYRFTTQTLYWIILGGLILALGLWVMTLNMQIQKLYDQVELNSAYTDNNFQPAAKAEKAE
ncbi:MAG TPA: hypothetical protein VFM68_03010 [Candidatus Saccharimonadales bacterium]|nr:hypothetical protein [Candidatus Saccharimonadales bacterium]